ncbi:MAG: DNA ligase D [Bryobacterales bacterium]|nr:DNA ligase D [Bryobacterales bacterium]
MPLEEYARKRSFSKTPEPRPAVEPSSGSRFFVQRHDATRLHYDFRLEIDGVLKSWAVPKGPSLDPADKRMAVHVEDHPLDYGNFEGNIPAGNYGAGSVMLWDRGTYELIGDAAAAEQLRRGDLKFRLHGVKLNGSFALVHMKGRGKGNDWLLIKKKDEYAVPGWDIESQAASVLTGRTQEQIAKELPAREPAGKPAAQSPMPRGIEVMKAFLAEAPPREGGWIYEIKWDGVRSLCYVENGAVRLVSRNGNVMDRQYPELSVLPHQVSARTAVLDGEIVALDPKGRPSFALLQNRITQSDPNSIAHLSRSKPVVLYLFDLLYADGEDLRDQPLLERKQRLASIVKPGGVIRISEHFPGSADLLLEAARENGLEGIVAKRAQSRYESQRSRDWLKIKVVSQQEFVICGFTEGEREHFGSLVLGVHRDGRLEYVGCVGSGFDQKLMEAVHRLLEPLVTTRPPFETDPKIGRRVTWVRPELVCEVRFASWTEDGRLRAPVFLGLRPDADPAETIEEAAGAATAAEPPASPGPLLPGDKEEVSLTIEGRRLKFTNLNKVWFPREGYAKRDIVNYYDAVSALILPHLRDRPLSLKRYPNGIESEYFFQKNTPEGYPKWLRVEPIPSEHNQAPIHYIVGTGRAMLLYLANLGCIDQNPWMSRMGSLEHPDFILIDLDPQTAEFRLVVEAAQLVRRKLDSIELEGYPKTTGGDGLHVYVPVEPVYSYEQTRGFAEVLARLLAAERPDLFTTPRPVARREKGRIYFDYLQNGMSKTIAAPYVARAYPGAPVATPLEWREVTPGLSPQQFNIRNAPDRFARAGDLFRGVLEKPQRLEPALEKLDELVRATLRPNA